MSFRLVKLGGEWCDVLCQITKHDTAPLLNFHENCGPIGPVVYIIVLDMHWGIVWMDVNILVSYTINL